MASPIRETTWELPDKPMTLIQMVNRRAAATGSVGYAMATAGADFNGHAISMDWREHSVHGAQWVGDYHWGERVTVVRQQGLENIAEALDKLVAEYGRQGAGASCRFHTWGTAEEQGYQIGCALARGFRPSGTTRITRENAYTFPEEDRRRFKKLEIFEKLSSFHDRDAGRFAAGLDDYEGDLLRTLPSHKGGLLAWFEEHCEKELRVPRGTRAEHQT